LDDPIFDQAIHRLVSQIESMMKQTKVEEEAKNFQQQYEYAMESEMSTLKTDFLLEDVEGQLSLRLVYWFLVTHGDVVEDSITGEIGGDSEENASTMNGDPSKGKAATVVTVLNRPTTSMQPNAGAGDMTTSKRNDNTKSVTLERKTRVLKIAPRIRTSLKSLNIIHDFHYINRYRTFDEIIWNAGNLDWVQTVRNCRMGLWKNVVAKLLERRWEVQPDLFLGITSGADIKDEKMRHLYKMVNEIKALIMA
jgi:hypothetical protein